LAHFDAATFSLDLVGFRKGDRDDAIFMACHDFSGWRVGEKIEDQAVFRVLGHASAAVDASAATSTAGGASPPPARASQSDCPAPRGPAPSHYVGKPGRSLLHSFPTAANCRRPDLHLSKRSVGWPLGRT